MEPHLLIGTPPGPNPQRSSLLDMLAYSRQTTLHAVRGLSQERLDAVPEGLANSIGMLLAHMAAVEVYYQRVSFEGRELNAEEQERWGAALELGEGAQAALQGRSLEALLHDLESSRAETLAGLMQHDDAWLLEPLPDPWQEGQQWNRMWMWFHVMEDELSHRGQIRLLRRLTDPQRTPAPSPSRVQD